MPCPMIPTLMTAGSTDTIPTDKLLIPSTMLVSVIGSYVEADRRRIESPEAAVRYAYICAYIRIYIHIYMHS